MYQVIREESGHAVFQALTLHTTVTCRHHAHGGGADRAGSPHAATVQDRPHVTTAEAARTLTRWDVAWLGAEAGTVVTYGYLSDEAAEGYATGHRGVSAGTRTVVEHVLSLIEDVANIRFEAVSGHLSSVGAADIAIMTQGGRVQPFAATTFAGSHITSAVINIDDFGNELHQPLDRIDYVDTLHEVLHAIGLAHPGAYNGSDALGYDEDAPYVEDTQQYSVMSYWSSVILGATPFWGSVHGPLTPQLHDIAALQLLYGTNTQTRAGDTRYGYDGTGGVVWDIDTRDAAGDAIIGTIWDGGGHDTLDGSRSSDPQILDLREDHFSSLGGPVQNVAVAVGALIEDAIGGYADDTIIGNSLGNRLYGGPGADTILGGGGDDVLYGDDGDLGPVRVSGSSGDDELAGNVRSNVISGGDGDDTLIGGEGADTLDGGTGRNTIVLSPDDWHVSHDGRSDLWFSVSEGAVHVVAQGGTALHSHAVFFASGGRAEFGGIDSINGTAFGDVFDLTGGSLFSGFLAAGDGNDLILCGDESREFHGGAGNDTLVGDHYASLYGGSGADVFALAEYGFGIDIHDFTIGTDVIDLREARYFAEGAAHRALRFSDLAFTDSVYETVAIVQAQVIAEDGWHLMSLQVYGLEASDLSATDFLF